MKTVERENVTVSASWLAQRGYTITLAARNVGVSANHLSLVTRGLRKPSKELVRRIKKLPALKAVKCRVAVPDNQ